MIRWRSLLIRTVVVVAIVFAARMALGPLAKRTATQMIWAGTDAHLQIGHSTVGLFPPVVRFDDVALSQDEAPGQAANASSGELLKAKSVLLEMDAEALLHRRYVVRSGRVEGLQLAAAPATLSPMGAKPIDPSERPAADHCFGEFVDRLSRLSEASANGAAKQLELTKRADQIRRRWKNEYTLLRQRAEELEASLSKASEASQGLSNPLRDRERLESALSKSKAIQVELAAVRSAMDALPDQIQTDLDSLEAAKQIDQSQFAQLWSAGTPSIQPETTPLLADTVNGQIDRLNDYLQLCRKLAKQSLVVHPASTRGQTMSLDRDSSEPQWLVERCEVSGHLLGGRQPIQLSGLLENLANHPKGGQEPLRARFKLDGDHTLRLDYSCDHSGDVPVDRLTLHWPETKAEPWALGNQQSLAVAIDGGAQEVWAQLESRGDQLTGRVMTRRTGLELDVQSTHATANSFVTKMRQTLSAINQVEVDAHFAGTQSDLTCEIVTNLTPLIKAGMDHALVAQTEAARLQWVARLDDVHQQELKGLQQSLMAEQTQTRDLVARADAKAESLNESLLGDDNRADAYLGRLRSSTLR